MPGKSLTTIVEELNNVLTVVAMCTDELEASGPREDALSDLRDAVRRGAELTHALAELRPKSLPPAAESTPVASDVRAAMVTVLLVEDEAPVRRAVASEIGATSGRGWSLLEASSIEEAFERLEGVPTLDVLVIDTTSASRRFASQVVGRHPNVVVVYTGGYTDDQPLRDELPKTEVSLLCRPFAIDTLIDRVRETLARRR